MSASEQLVGWRNGNALVSGSFQPAKDSGFESQARRFADLRIGIFRGVSFAFAFWQCFIFAVLQMIQNMEWTHHARVPRVKKLSILRAIALIDRTRMSPKVSTFNLRRLRKSYAGCVD